MAGKGISVICRVFQMLRDMDDIPITDNDNFLKKGVFLIFRIFLDIIMAGAYNKP